MNFFSKPNKPEDKADDELVSSYRQHGDVQVLGKLYERYMPLVYGVCLKYLTDDELAKDAVMAIFEELITKARQHDIKQFRSWLYVLARNHCLMQIRAGKKMETVNLDDFVEFTPVLHHDTENREEALQALERCMQKLTLPQKQSVSMFYLHEKCYKEIADATGYTMNEVKSYIQNGKRNLKICLEKNSGK
ncbi:sigma-70 family RNA polymerase sigma factor [Mucilaginibacter pallidiroseus]|uniref:Sigma-70 family RNA polymerase sigma factor n=1 Tax=Mucilaginibacter pallidiroseus TaxID=2599295 RepID=A0A563UGV7_9SPHI|nr:sigma-70 family RNA polymerase sigma factor [Mucilaginibacter pallidiroseus]TWR30519.1 sigma-70 family RNA polymerase sigma factor [Mucilaginibacter pallidiroseus]